MPAGILSAGILSVHEGQELKWENLKFRFRGLSHVQISPGLFNPGLKNVLGHMYVSTPG